MFYAVGEQEILPHLQDDYTEDVVIYPLTLKEIEEVTDDMLVENDEPIVAICFLANVDDFKNGPLTIKGHSIIFTERVRPPSFFTIDL